MTKTTFNPGYTQMFAPQKLSLGLFFAIEAYEGSIPTMQNQVELAQAAERYGYAALWFRDVPLNDPSFGDVGQIYDPWVYLAYIAAQTSRISLATGSIVLPLKHPLHLAKAAASVDQLSRGRLVLGVASGDRPVEYPAFKVDFDSRGVRFQETLLYMRAALEHDFPVIESSLGRMEGVDLIPKPYSGRIPMLITGQSQQSLEWIAEQGDGWIYYPRNLTMQRRSIEKWRELTEQHGTPTFKPFVQSLYIDLDEKADAPASPIHLGFKLGRNALRDFLHASQEIGVNHIAFNLKYGSRPAADVVQEIGEELLGDFATGQT